MSLTKCCLCDKIFEDSRHRSRCKSCNTKIRRVRAKAAAIALLGGRCVRCGYVGHPAAFEFHHVGEKEFAIGNATNRSWEVIKQELQKCILLCSNCHRIEHSNRTDQRFLDEAAKYQGNILN